MAVAVVNYPTLRKEDLEWIQSIRRKNDPLYYTLIQPHFAVVFPTEKMSEGMMIEHVKRKIAGVAPFEVVFRCVLLGDPSFQGHAHAYLVPDEGFSGLVRLHDLLYTGPLAGELRLDLPFIPHVAVANAPKPEDCKVIVDVINSKPFELQGRVETLDVIGYDGERVWTVERMGLGDPSDVQEIVK
jgi:hypothetical protein